MIGKLSLRQLSGSRVGRVLIGTSCAGACFSSVAYCHSKNIQLSHVAYSASRSPSVVLIHGLDSAKDTWSTFQEELHKRNIDSIALDLRGHGESPMGNPEEFSSPQLANDIRHTLDILDVQKPFILLGHSMGGKVVTQYTVQFPDDVCDLIIEDMHHWESKRDVQPSEYDRRKDFDRSFPSFDVMFKKLQEYGYSESRILGWKATGRVFAKENGSWWSNINPFAALLAHTHVLKLNFEAQLKEIIQNHKVPVHLYYAKWDNSVCNKESVAEMEAMGVKGTQFENAYHSIHNTQREDMLDAVEALVRANEARSSA